MFATIRKHQTWLWAFIIAAVIVSFVIYFTPSADRRGGGGGRSQFGTINGRPISRNEYLQAYVESRLGFLLRYGQWPDQSEARRAGANLERDTRNRLVLLESLRQLNVQVDQGAIAQWILDNFGGGQPSTAKSKYDSFVRELRQRHGVGEAEFQQFIQHEIALAHLASVTGVAGKLLTPRSAAEAYRQENEKIEAEAVLFSLSNHLAAVTVEPAALAQFYTNRQSVYRIPERIQLQYVRFDLTNYFAQADLAMAKLTNLSAEIDRLYLSSNPNSFTDTNGQVLDPDAAKAKIREQLRDRQALVEAHKAAARFATNLETMNPPTLAGFTQLATANGLTPLLSEPFAEFESPHGLRVRQNFGEMAFKLTPEAPVALSPIRGEDAVYVIALKERIPSSVPALDAIHARVELEFRQDQALRLAREAGTNFVAALTNGLAHGKTFADVCSEANVTPVSLPRFSAATRAPLNDWDRRIDLNQAKSAASGLPAGRATPLLNTRDGGLVLYVKSRIPVSDAEVEKELPQYLAGMRQSEEYEAFNEWFRHQLDLSRIETIGSRDQGE